MRHRSAVKKLGRTHEHRKAMMANMATSLFQNKRISTTITKAKALRSFSEKMITFGKKETGEEKNTAARRLAFKHLRNKEAVKLLFEEIAPKYSDRNGGYTRVLKLGQRQGDAAQIAIIELVDFEKTYKKKEESKTSKKKAKDKVKEASAAKEDTKKASREEVEVKEEMPEEVKTEEVKAEKENKEDVKAEDVSKDEKEDEKKED